MAPHPIATAVILAIGSELTTGSTRDTNSGELAAELTGLGVEILGTQALPDDITRVRDAFSAGLAQADLVVSTGGLGPTPDDLTREAIAAATGLHPSVDPTLERWLRQLFARRGIDMPATNLKQAWLVPGANALHNGHGTAPGWWLEVGDRLIVALPGPPREMWPMWRTQVLPGLERRGVGAQIVHETLRLTGIGESALAELLGDELRRGRDPEVATYARADAVDVRISSRGDGAAQRVAATLERVTPRLERYVFARGGEGWPEVLGRLLDGRTLATVEASNGGQLIALLGEAPFIVRGEVHPTGAPAAELAAEVRAGSGADIALGLRTHEGAHDIDVEIAIASAAGLHSAERKAFLTGPEGHRRAALAACTELWHWLRRPAASGGAGAAKAPS